MAAEGKSLLPIKTMERVNLRECYHSLLLAVFTVKYFCVIGVHATVEYHY